MKQAVMDWDWMLALVKASLKVNTGS